MSNQNTSKDEILNKLESLDIGTLTSDDINNLKNEALRRALADLLEEKLRPGPVSQMRSNHSSHYQSTR